MKYDIRAWLQDGDPLKDDPGLAHDDVVAMRRAVLGAVKRRDTTPAFWIQPLQVAAVVMLMVIAGIVGGRRLPAPHIEATLAPAEHETPTKMQLQFSTPGGTRIIWFFDDSAREVLP